MNPIENQQNRKIFTMNYCPCSWKRVQQGTILDGFWRNFVWILVVTQGWTLLKISKILKYLVWIIAPFLGKAFNFNLVNNLESRILEWFWQNLVWMLIVTLGENKKYTVSVFNLTVADTIHDWCWRNLEHDIKWNWEKYLLWVIARVLQTKLPVGVCLPCLASYL